MNLLFPATKTFSLLTIGQRGVGKTVFLAGSYAELHAGIQKRSQKLWFDCQEQGQKNIERLLSYVVETGQYPPPTMRATNFNFSLKRHSFWGDQLLSDYRWWEIPGEICKLSNLDFLKIVSSSHGCCVFIDAYALMHNQTHLQEVEEIVETVMHIATLVYLSDSKYAFALILTKCDLLEPSSFSQQQLQEKLQPLTTRLDAVKTNYRVFYSRIPIVQIKGVSTLSATGAAAPLLWLVWELSKAHNPGLMNNLLDFATSLLPTGLQMRQELQELQDGSLQSLFRPWKLNAQKDLAVKKLLTVRRLSLLTLTIVGLVGGLGILAVNHEFQREFKNPDTLKDLTHLRQTGQFNQAVLLMEKLVQQEPNDLELHLQLAELYQLTGNLTRAEIAYDRVLAQQKNNLKALVGKAILRNAQGDTKTAAALFIQAEKAAPTDDIKVQIRKVAQKTLKPPTK